jgi:hypothetical protein
VRAIVHLDRLYYDVSRLRRDLAVAEDATWSDHFARRYYSGTWDGLPLVSAEGRADVEGLRRGAAGARYLKTELLSRCPYFEAVINSFDCQKERVRLMRLRPGAIIEPHDDPGQGWSDGVARMHVPITTNEGVSLTLDGETVSMSPGELWYLDVERVHSARNAGSTDRVHLVLDLVVNDFVRSLFPAER